LPENVAHLGEFLETNPAVFFDILVQANESNAKVTIYKAMEHNLDQFIGYFLDNLPSMTCWRVFPFFGQVLHDYANIPGHQTRKSLVLKFIPFYVLFMFFLSSFYLMTTSSAALRGVDFSFFFCFLSLFSATLPPNALTDFVN
jgi:hypothetical protein